MGRDIVMGLILILMLIAMLTVCSVVCRADNLNGQEGFEAVLLNMLHASSTHADWTETKIDELNNMGITFIEGVAKSNLVHDTLTFNINEDAVADTGFCYALSANARSGGVLNVFYVYSSGGATELVALSQRNIEDFGKDRPTEDAGSSAKFTYMYSTAFDTLLLYPIPDKDYVMHIISYKVSNWMTGVAADTVVTLPLFHRLLALEMAYGYAQLSTNTTEGFQRFTTIRQGVLEALYGLPPEPEAQVQSLGIAEER